MLLKTLHDKLAKNEMSLTLAELFELLTNRELALQQGLPVFGDNGWEPPADAWSWDEHEMICGKSVDDLRLAMRPSVRKVAADALRTLAMDVSFARDLEEFGRFECAGCLLETGPTHMSATATDGRRMVRRTVPVDRDNALPSIVLDYGTFEALLDMPYSDNPVWIKFDGSNGHFQWRSDKVTTTVPIELPSRPFPSTEQLFIDCQNREPNYMVRILATPPECRTRGSDKVRLLAGGIMQRENTQLKVISERGTHVPITFNGEYLRQWLDAVRDDDAIVRIEIVDEELPVYAEVVSYVTKQQGQYEYVWMPMK